VPSAVIADGQTLSFVAFLDTLTENARLVDQAAETILQAQRRMEADGAFRVSALRHELALRNS
jgi:hypothetical protein